MYSITLYVIDINNISCLEPFLPHYDHFEIWRFLGLNWQYQLKPCLVLFRCDEGQNKRHHQQRNPWNGEGDDRIYRLQSRKEKRPCGSLKRCKPYFWSNKAYSSGWEADNTLHMVTIFINSPTFDLMTKDAKTTFMDQLAVIGGTLGLFAGFSIISGI